VPALLSLSVCIRCIMSGEPWQPPSDAGTRPSIAPEVEALLITAHAQLAQGNAPAALHALLDALQRLGPDGGAIEAVARVRQALSSGNNAVSPEAAVQQVSMLLASCRLDSTQAVPEPMRSSLCHPHPPGYLLSKQAGRHTHPMQDGRDDTAAGAADAIVCQHCKALISRPRAEMHAALWCPALGPQDML